MKSHVFHRFAMALVASALLVSSPLAQATTLQDSVPVLSSRPGAAYTIYLDPSGFAYDGDWIGETPGTNLGFRDAPPGDTFTASDQDAISAMWAAMANQYRSFDVNVTTVDPAAALVNPADTQADNDLVRKDFYDSQARMMHTVIGPPGNAGWQGSADGLAGLNVIDSVAAAGSGEHTNWMFSQDVNNGDDVQDGTYIGNISSHEGGHTFGLQHQGDFTAGGLVNEYSNGDTNPGPGSYVPTMGNASGRQRVAFRVGTAHDDNDDPFQQNDVAVIAGNAGMTFADSGIGHSFITATDLPITGDIVDVNDPLHRGQINPIDQGGGTFDPIGFDKYTADYFSFQTDGINPITLTLHNGNDLLTPGVADNGATLRGFLEIYDSSLASLATGTESVDTLSTTYTGTLAAGMYFAQISSFGGHTEDSIYDAAQYYDMGGYFLTGSGFALIPEPATGSLILVSFAFCVFRRGRRSV
ncbi:PEP-CTERM sorting domain-containing protein [Adhaeretor mobilis]|uniref:Uncharacterized protein n=1 Tax=Adhaeretor mobilis TaxID=1930276 RepID=A0A517N370_9BACT|nr:PEP-CTERM sorting domain-containing protein [Adhaeretor mobilis]QDT01587.1 hypothetical protein HG15A2_49340 [Adhaeretor mobilis]